ncbi:MAG TPA: DUF642 domain-containing protein [Verrucomicrobiae bacterium]
MVATFETNAYFPAFPGATGSGGGAAGGRFGSVYHVTTNYDSGPGTLRDAVNSATNNRTVVFDISGTINLLSPLVITNSNLTIAGQTAPGGGGITVAGQMTTVQSAHDVIIRDVRFRPASASGSAVTTVWSNGFENNAVNSTVFAPSYFAGGWHIDFGSVDWLNYTANGCAPVYEGNYFIDLDGSSAGGISTNITTVTGATYTLTFGYTKNPNGVAPKAQILINGNPLGTVAPSYATSVGSLNWQTTSFVFTATSPSTKLAINSLDSAGSISGVFLDGFSLTTNVAAVGDALQFLNASNIIADHISASWSPSNLVSVLNSSNVTVQWSIIADSLYVTNNPAPLGSSLRYGNGALSFNHNLYADNFSGNPQLGGNISLDFVNNVVYNWGLFSGLSDTNSGFTNQLNYSCNYLIAGPDTVTFGTNYAITNIAFWGGSTNTWIFQTNNFIDSNNNGILDGANTQWTMFTNQFTKFSHPFSLIPVLTDEAFIAYEKVLDFAGVNMSLRDSVDTNIVGKVRNQTGTLINLAGSLPVLNSSSPYLDTDQDGIPDFWEITFGTDRFTPSNNNDRDGDGYTDLEEYDNWLAAPHALTVTNTPVGVDLQSLFGKTGNLSFSVGNGSNGTVYLTNVLGVVTNTGVFSNSIAIFTPTNNFGGGTNNFGYAAFDAFVTNNDTVAYFGPVTVSVVVSKVPVAINSNMPPVIITLTSGVGYDTCPSGGNSGGSDFYHIVVTTNDADALFELDNPTGPMALVVRYGLPLPSLSSYDYFNNAPSAPANLQISVSTNSAPVPLAPGDWYMAAINVSGSNVCYTAKITKLGSVLPPVFLFPTNSNVFTNIETTLFTNQCQATDPNTPTLPLTYALVSGPAGGGLTVSAAGAINWTPNEAQGPSTNPILVSVSNGAFTITNNFTVVVLESNLPPVFVLTNIPDQIAFAGNLFTFTNAATDPDLPVNPLTYSLLAAPPAGAGISTNGVITWTPALAQVGTTNVFTTVVTDTNPWAVNTQSFSITNFFSVVVLPPPTLNNGVSLTNSIPPGGFRYYQVSVPANADFATNILLFATNLPVNLFFNQTNLPTGAGPGDFTLLANASNGRAVLATSSAPPLLPGATYYLGVQNTNAFAVTCGLEVDFHLVPPVFISSIVYTNINNTNGFLLTWFAPTNDYFRVQWTPTLAPTNWTTFPLPPAIGYNQFISPTNSQFNFFDDGSQTGGSFGSSRFYRLILLQPNTLTFLATPSNQIVSAGSSIATVTNTATDSDTNAVLNYSLVSSPAGATINTNNGVITWTNASPSGLAARFNTLVTDNGTLAASATNTFTVFVMPFPSITNVTATATNVILSWTAPTNDQFNVQWTTNLAPPSWTLFPNNLAPLVITSTTGVFTFTDTNLPLVMKFYRLLLLP